MPPKIVVLGSVNTDLVIRGPRLPSPGETVLGGQFYQAHGGKGANQAVAAARAGQGEVTLIAAVGDDDFGRGATDHFGREGLDLRYVKLVPDRPSGVALILVDENGENLISVASGANAELTPGDVDDVPEQVFADAKVFLTCMELPLETVARGLVRARAAGLVTILNPAPADPAICRLGVLPCVDVITPNAGEAAVLTDTRPRGRSGAVAAAKKLQQLGCASCVVTLGAEGCVAVDRKTTKLPACRIKAVDATAAGDGFNGALAVALAEGRPLAEAAAWANRAAAIAASRAGAQPSLPKRAEIEAFEA